MIFLSSDDVLIKVSPIHFPIEQKSTQIRRMGAKNDDKILPSLSVGSPPLGKRVGTRWPFSNNYTDKDNLIVNRH
jgi:hypothetical protein